MKNTRFAVVAVVCALVGGTGCFPLVRVLHQGTSVVKSDPSDGSSAVRFATGGWVVSDGVYAPGHGFYFTTGHDLRLGPILGYWSRNLKPRRAVPMIGAQAPWTSLAVDGDYLYAGRLADELRNARECGVVRFDLASRDSEAAGKRSGDLLIRGLLASDLEVADFDGDGVSDLVASGYAWEDVKTISAASNELVQDVVDTPDRSLPSWLSDGSEDRPWVEPEQVSVSDGAATPSDDYFTGLVVRNGGSGEVRRMALGESIHSLSVVGFGSSGPPGVLYASDTHVGIWLPLGADQSAPPKALVTIDWVKERVGDDESEVAGESLVFLGASVVDQEFAAIVGCHAQTCMDKHFRGFLIRGRIVGETGAASLEGGHVVPLRGLPGAVVFADLMADNHPELLVGMKTELVRRFAPGPWRYVVDQPSEDPVSIANFPPQRLCYFGSCLGGPILSFGESDTDLFASGGTSSISFRPMIHKLERVMVGPHSESSGCEVVRLTRGWNSDVTSSKFRDERGCLCEDGCENRAGLHLYESGVYSEIDQDVGLIRYRETVIGASVLWAPESVSDDSLMIFSPKQEE
jgi:hypothetical protein